jgi:hypothetical protein
MVRIGGVRCYLQESTAAGVHFSVAGGHNNPHHYLS